MRFLGGLIKVIAILLMLAVTIGCTAVIVLEGIVEGYEEAIWIMSLAWVAAMLFCSCILGIGVALTQLSKLKKRVEQLEKNQTVMPVQYVPVPEVTPAAPAAAPVAPAIVATEPEVAEVPPMAPQPAAPQPVASQPVVKPVVRKKNKKWIPIVAIVAAAAVVVALMIVGISALSDDPSDETEMQTPAATEAPMIEPEVIPGGNPGAGAIPVMMGGTIENEFFTMTFNSLELLDEYSYRTSDYSKTSLYVEEGYKLLLVKGHFVNNYTEAISDSMFVRTAVVNGTYKLEDYDVRMDFQRSKSHEIDPYTEMEYVLYINIPNKLAEQFETVTFTLGYNNDLSIPVTEWDMEGNKTVKVDIRYSLTCSTLGSAPVMENGQPAEEAVKTIAIGETIVTKDYEFTLRNVELTYEVLPPNTSSVYTSYVAESGKVYVHVEADVKNTMQRDIRIDELFTTSVLYAGKYPYGGFTVVNDGDNRFDWVGNYVAATPLETCRAHGLVECPVEVDESGDSVIVRIVIGGETYEYVLR